MECIKDPLFFFIVLDVYRPSLQMELYANDSVLMVKSLKLVKEKKIKWENGKEGMALRAYVGKTRVMRCWKVAVWYL